jgi:hypothetical protein
MGDPTDLAAVRRQLEQAVACLQAALDSLPER